MSRMATAEYIGAKRRAYAEAGSAKRRRLLDEVCETTGYSRKYANRLLTGNRKFRERKGRGKVYQGEVLGVLEKVWREAGCPCLPYFKAEPMTTIITTPATRGFRSAATRRWLKRCCRVWR